MMPPKKYKAQSFDLLTALPFALSRAKGIFYSIKQSHPVMGGFVVVGCCYSADAVFARKIAPITSAPSSSR